MTKTTNYQLPQWEAKDPIRREEFNGAMAKIDEGLSACYTTERVPAYYLKANATSKSAGDVLCTFSETPKFVIVFGTYASVFLIPNTQVHMIDYYAYSSAYTADFKLSGNQLILVAKGDSYSGSNIRVVVFP